MDSITNDDTESRKRLYKEMLTDLEVDLLYDIIEITNDILNQNNIRYTIAGGTLLGAVRNGGLIPHDNDADFDVLEDDLDQIRSLVDQFALFGLIIIEIPGWGLQISHKNSPDLEVNLWSDNIGNKWTSKWPFLDLISIKYDNQEKIYKLAQETAKHDYPDYYLTEEDWKNPFEKIKFGHLNLWVISKNYNRINYLDRNYKDWNKIIEMNMDHRKNIYFDKPIKCNITTNDLVHRSHSKKLTN